MKQRGSLTLGMGITIAVLGVALIAAGAWAKREATQRAEVEGKFAAFKESVKTLGEEAEKDRKKKEKENAENLSTAVGERDAARKQLRDYAGKSAGSRKLPSATAASSSSGQSCIGTAAYLAAMAAFRKELGSGMAAADGYTLAGDEAQIDAQTLLKGWPK